jgi:hypothetical protein
LPAVPAGGSDRGVGAIADRRPADELVLQPPLHWLREQRAEPAW